MIYVPFSFRLLVYLPNLIFIDNTIIHYNLLLNMIIRILAIYYITFISYLLILAKILFCSYIHTQLWSTKAYFCTIAKYKGILHAKTLWNNWWATVVHCKRFYRPFLWMSLRITWMKKSWEAIIFTRFSLDALW